MRASDLTGFVSGRLTVVSRRGSDNRGEALWLCRCECGAERAIRAFDLRKGYTKSCGCLSAETTRNRSKTHGATVNAKPTPEYLVWMNMRRRCNDPQNTHYEYYGGRGISVCTEWENDFATFLADMGLRPSASHTIDRIDNDGGYARANCRWATRSQQARNQRNVRLVSLNGEMMPIVDAADRLGVPANRIYNRLASGWTEEDALSI